jgi:hypothetical protein
VRDADPQAHLEREVGISGLPGEHQRPLGMLERSGRRPGDAEVHRQVPEHPCQAGKIRETDCQLLSRREVLDDALVLGERMERVAEVQAEMAWVTRSRLSGKWSTAASACSM